MFGVSLNPVPHGVLDDHSVAACCRLCDAWSVIGESLAAAAIVSAGGWIAFLGLSHPKDKARRLADGEAALNVAAAPFPAPCPAPSLGKKVYAKPLVKKDRWSSEDCARNQRTDSCRRRLSGVDKDVRTPRTKRDRINTENRAWLQVHRWRPRDDSRRWRKTTGVRVANEDIFYMTTATRTSTRGEAGLQLSEGLRVTYERTTNTRGPIAHYVKVGEAEAPAPPAPPPPR